MEGQNQVQANTPVSDQGFSNTEAQAPSSMEAAIRQEHQGESNVSAQDNTSGLYAGKYKSVEELSDGYKNLQSRFDSHYGSFTGAPEGDYTYSPHADLADSDVQLDPASETRQRFDALCKESNMSEKLHNNLLDLFTHEQIKLSSQQEASSAAQETESYNNYIKELGGNEQAVLNQVEAMVNKLGTVPGMDDTKIAAMVENITDTKAFQGMQQLLNQLDYADVPGSLPTSQMSQADLSAKYQEMKKMPYGPAKERAKQEVDRLFNQYYPGELEMG
jgi:hypothetical protein